MSAHETTPIASRVQEFLKRGVVIRCPGSVDIDPSVSLEGIAPGTIIHGGCRISGEDTSIGPDCTIGNESPATLVNCRLESKVTLGGGYFAESVFLRGAGSGSCAHVRPGCLLEEGVRLGHSVGLKQTILLPFVTLGSMVNFCDILMAGGTSREDHGEVGSSYVHFNFTPHGDKATPSLIGDIPRGVLIDQPSIFLGGQGGLVGPTRIEYGCVVPAGSICRTDMLEPGTLTIPEVRVSSPVRPYKRGVYRGINRTAGNNLIFIGNLFALDAWYRTVRSVTMGGTSFGAACLAGAMLVLKRAVSERIAQLETLSGNLEDSASRLEQDDSLEAARQRSFSRQWASIRERLETGPPDGLGSDKRDAFMSVMGGRSARSGDHVETVRAAPDASRVGAVAWLQSVVDWTLGLWPDQNEE
ncbi:MAG: UDP-N-acetylglucosamine pyrophosphorylase [Lentisphaerales bacterium]|nr:MAG: UDP-N-acetylglucosamine pyrophosphorylase [Lentisphaerales bacterium]